MLIWRSNGGEDFKIILRNGFFNAAFDFVSLLAELAEVEAFQFLSQVADLK